MEKISFNFRQWWRNLLSFLRVRRFEGVITNASEEDIAKSSFKSPEEALEFLRKDAQKSREQSEQWQEHLRTISLSKKYLSEIKVGMIWYEDDTFSFKRKANKKIRAIVELIEDGVVYGDLTVSELHDIQEQRLNWEDAQKYINSLYSRKDNTQVVWYNVEQLEKVCKTYELVDKTFKRIGKRGRDGWFWSSTKLSAKTGWGVYVNSGNRWEAYKVNYLHVRPVLRLELQ